MDPLEFFIHISAVILESAGVGVIVVGAVISIVLAVIQFFRKDPDVFYLFRRHLIRSILLGLEFLIAADIIRTVAIEPDFNSVGVLAAIILVRTFLSYTLEVEITGKWPWQEKGDSKINSGNAQ